MLLEKPEVFNKLLSRSLKRHGRSVTYQVASLGDLERMKKASGRSIDLADIALIEERRTVDKKIPKKEL